MALLTDNATRRWLVRLAVGVLVLSLRPAGTAPLEEHHVKAAFLYNFAKFITWPQPPAFAERRRFVFGLIGGGATAEALPDLVRNKTVHGYPVEVRRVRDLAEIGACDVLYVAESDGDRLAAILAHLRQARVLTVSDVSGFARRGGMIELYLEGGRVRFAINVRVMRAAGLEPSSKLLALANIVDEPPEDVP